LSIDSLASSGLPDSSATFGKFHNLTAPYQQADCNGIVTSYIGAAFLVWDSSTSTCKSRVFECDKGYTFDDTSSSCVQPANEIVDTSMCSGSFLINYMSHLDFCNDDCSLSVPAWTVPVGYEGFNLQCGHSYTEYRCSEDYRVKKFTELSCSSTSAVHTLTLQPDATLAPIQSDINNLPDVNISSSSVKNISSLKTIGSKIDTTNKKLDEFTKNLQDIEDTLNGNGNSATFSNPNATNQEGLMKFLNGAKDGFDTITSNYETLKHTVDNGFSVPSLSVGVEPKFKATVFNKNVEIDLCTSFSFFRPVVYYAFLIIFHYLSIMIFFKSFKILIK